MMVCMPVMIFHTHTNSSYQTMPPDLQTCHNFLGGYPYYFRENLYKSAT